MATPISSSQQGQGAATIVNPNPKAGQAFNYLAEGVKGIGDAAAKAGDAIAKKLEEEKAAKKKAASAANKDFSAKGLNASQIGVYKQKFDETYKGIQEGLEAHPEWKEEEITSFIKGEWNDYESDYMKGVAQNSTLSGKFADDATGGLRGGGLIEDMRIDPSKYMLEDGTYDAEAYQKDMEQALGSTRAYHKPAAEFRAYLEENRKMIDPSWFSTEIDEKTIGTLPMQEILKQLKPEFRDALMQSYMEGTINPERSEKYGDFGAVTDLIEGLPAIAQQRGLAPEEYEAALRQRVIDRKMAAGEEDPQVSDKDLALEALKEQAGHNTLSAETLQRGYSPYGRTSGKTPIELPKKITGTAMGDDMTGKSYEGDFTRTEGVGTDYITHSIPDGKGNMISGQAVPMGTFTASDGSKHFVWKTNQGAKFFVPATEEEAEAFKSGAKDSESKDKILGPVVDNFMLDEEVPASNFDYERFTNLENTLRTHLEAQGMLWGESPSTWKTPLKEAFGDFVSFPSDSSVTVGGETFDIVDRDTVGWAKSDVNTDEFNAFIAKLRFIMSETKNEGMFKDWWTGASQQNAPTGGNAPKGGNVRE